MGFIGFIVLGENLFGVLQQRVPEFYTRISQNKWGWGIGAWFIGNRL
jgi:hypothetical protein